MTSPSFSDESDLSQSNSSPDSETVQQGSDTGGGATGVLTPASQQNSPVVLGITYTSPTGDSIAPSEEEFDQDDYGGGPNQKPDPPESGGFV